MHAIEQGGSTATTMKRLRELESKQEELKRQILIEKSKTAVQITADQVREFYEKALRLKPQMLIGLLIKEILLFDDKIQIQFNTLINGSPDESLGFSFCKKQLALHIQFRSE